MNLNPWQLALHRGRNLYDWQIQTLEAFGNGWPTALCACNGSGKSTEVAGAAVEWFFEKHPQGWLVATSSSFNQLQNQTWAAIESRLPGDYQVRRATSPLGIKAPGSKDRTGGEGVGFSTKDAGRAEGWHPKIGKDTDPVMILIDEAKTVPDAIWTAFDRCTVSFMLVISSPGPPRGRFFECFRSLSAYYWTIQVPSTLCPHIDPAKRERDKQIHGEDSALYRSMHLAEFTEDGEHLVITSESLEAAIQIQPKYDKHQGETVAFFDFARGGDENVFYWRHGNQVRMVEAWRDRDTVQAVRKFIRLAKGLEIPSAQCWGDADGLGGPMVDQFRDQQFPINEFHGGASPMDSTNYSNLISEVWIQGVRRLERGDFNIGLMDPRVKEQLTTRKFEWDARGKKRVESKEDMRKRGLDSPDRADALLGCIMCGSHMTGAVSKGSFLRPEQQSEGSGGFGGGVVTGF